MNKIFSEFSKLKRIKIRDNGEPILKINKYLPQVIIKMDKKRAEKEKTLYARKTVIKKLKKALEFLSPKYKFKIRDAWRPISEQERYYQRSIKKRKRKHPDWSEKKIINEARRWTFPPDIGLVPYHTTGGAVDLTICYKNGRSIPMNSKKEKLPKHILKNRELLKDIMEKVGFSNYPVEWWHFSYGDSGWAYRTGRKIAIYGGIEK